MLRHSIIKAVYLRLKSSEVTAKDGCVQHFFVARDGLRLGIASALRRVRFDVDTST